MGVLQLFVVDRILLFRFLLVVYGVIYRKYNYVEKYILLLAIQDLVLTTELQSTLTTVLFCVEYLLVQTSRKGVSARNNSRGGNY